MNLFRLDDCPSVSAQNHHDIHVRKMSVEICQILQNPYSLERMAGDDCPKTQAGKSRSHGYRNHPICVWARQSLGNFKWALSHGRVLHEEFILRFGKKHFCLDFIEWCLKNSPDIPSEAQTEQPQCFKQRQDLIVKNNPVLGYRNYYNAEKLSFMIRDKKVLAKWTNRSIPLWVDESKLH